MINLETAVTTRGTPEPKRFHFRAPARVPAVGAGANAAAAFAPWITEIRGTRLAFLGFSQVFELWSAWQATDTRAGVAMARDLPRAVAAVRAARQQADVVVVYVHWGEEGQSCPPDEARAFAREMANAGASIVAGTHAHLLLGDGWIGNTFVQYGLGNFVWRSDDAFSNDTGVLQVTLRGSAIEKTALLPALISRQTGQPEPATGQDANRISQKYANLRACTGLAPTRSGTARPGR